MTICAMVAMSLFFFGKFNIRTLFCCQPFSVLTKQVLTLIASANEDIDSGLVQADDDMDYKRAQLSSLITYLVNALENSEEDSSENEEKFRKSIYLPRIGMVFKNMYIF